MIKNNKMEKSTLLLFLVSELMPCCPPASRHGLHQHYKHLPVKNKLIYQRDDTPWPGGLSDNDKYINDILAEEGRQLELLLGGKGTLAKCISKEVFGNEDVELPMRCVIIIMRFKV